MATRTKKGLSAAVSSGLNRKRLEKASQRSAGQRVILKDGSTVPVQFLDGPDEAKEYEIHRFQEDGSWNIVPCLGEGCPLCDDESDNKSKTSYRFCMNVYNMQEKKVQVLEGPADMANKIVFKFDRIPGTTAAKNKKFKERTWEVTRYPTNPTTYGMDKGEEDPVPTRNMKLIDLGAYVDSLIKNYYGDELPTASSLDGDDVDDEDDVDEDDADEWTEKELKRKSVASLKKIAAEEGVSKKDIREADDDKAELIALILGEEDEDEDDDEEEDEDFDEDEDDEDEDEDEEDEDEDEDEDEEDEEPAPRRSAKKSSSKPAKKTATRRRR